MDVTLGYPLQGQLANAADKFLAKRWTPNAAYDVDPSLGSTSTPGFSEWANLYSYYRVIEYEIDLSIANLDPQPYALYFIHTNTDPGLGGSTYYDYASMPYCSRGLIGVSGGQDRYHYRKMIRCANILGSIAVETSDSLRSVVTSVPADLLYFGLGINSLTNTNMVIGIGYVGGIRMKIRFYGRQNLLTTLAPLRSKFERERELEKVHRELKQSCPADQTGCEDKRPSSVRSAVIKTEESANLIEAPPLDTLQVKELINEAVQTAMEDLTLKCVTLSMNAVVKAMAAYVQDV